MEIEDVARVGFAAGRTTQQQRHLAVGDGLFRQVIIDDQRVHAVVAEELAHDRAREWREVLQRRRLGSRGGDDDRVFQRAALFERLDDLCDRRTLLTDDDVDAVELLALVAAGVDVFLVEDGVDRHSRLAGLAVANDQLALATTDRNQTVDRLDAGRHRLMHRFARQDAWGLDVHTAALGDILQRTLAVDWFT